MCISTFYGTQLVYCNYVLLIIFFEIKIIAFMETVRNHSKLVSLFCYLLLFNTNTINELPNKKILVTKSVRYLNDY